MLSVAALPGVAGPVGDINAGSDEGEWKDASVTVAASREGPKKDTAGVAAATREDGGVE